MEKNKAANVKKVFVNFNIKNSRDIEILESLRSLHFPLASIFSFACGLYSIFLNGLEETSREQWFEFVLAYHVKYRKKYPFFGPPTYRRVEISCYDDEDGIYSQLSRCMEQFPYSKKEFVMQAAWYFLYVIKKMQVPAKDLQDYMPILTDVVEKM